MQKFPSIYEKVTKRWGQVTQLEEEVLIAELTHNQKCYSVVFIDFLDDVVGRAEDLISFQDRILGDKFFSSQGDLRWNKYLYFLAGQNSLNHPGYLKAKTLIESDKDYARKRVVTEAELETLLNVSEQFNLNDSVDSLDIVAEWEKRLSSADLDELFNRPSRKEVIYKIGNGTARRAQDSYIKSVTNPSDSLLTEQWLACISIDRFRPVHDGKSYSFGQVNLIVGPNGTGKTSLLEAIEFFYCGANRRPGSKLNPNISARIAGDPELIKAPTQANQIKARCLNWYNRDEHLSRAIIDSFTRYNFLDTDAAFRLSTELTPSEIPNDLNRLIVGADASTIWDYLNKIYPEIEAAADRASDMLEDVVVKLRSAEVELKELQNLPSNGKFLTDTFRSSLKALNWKLPFSTAALTSQAEIERVQEALMHLKAILSAGPNAINLRAVYKRIEEINSAIEIAQPMDTQRKELSKQIKNLEVEVAVSTTSAERLDRWLTYVNTGFSAAYTNYIEAKNFAENAQRKLGLYAQGDITNIQNEYSTRSLDSALQEVTSKVEDWRLVISQLQDRLSGFDRAAYSRSQAAQQLQAAVKAVFENGHPEDDCPICHAKYSSGQMSRFIDQITETLRQPSELETLTSQLTQAQQNLVHYMDLLRNLEYLQRIAATLELPFDVVCNSIPAKVFESRKLLAEAELKLEIATKEWSQLSNLDLNIDEHDFLKSALIQVFPDTHSLFDATVITITRDQMFDYVSDTKKRLDELNQDFRVIASNLTKLIGELASDGWSRHLITDIGINSFNLFKQEITTIENRVHALLSLMDIDEAKSFQELNSELVGIVGVHSEALLAISKESSASDKNKLISESVKQLTEDLQNAQDKKHKYQSARDVLESLIKEASLDKATQETLKLIGSQINDIFGRIHTPSEYEYVGSEDVILRTSATHEKRTLDQISTGQRAAFALSVFLAMNRSATSAPPALLIDDPIAHIDDLNALSFLDYLRDLTINTNRQIFFATADTRIASLFSRKFSFLGDSFVKIELTNNEKLEQEVSRVG